MPGYLEAYRLARAKAKGSDVPVAAQNTDNENRATSGAGDGTSIPTSSQSFQAAKLSLDRAERNNDAKSGKDKVRKWSSTVDSAHPVAAEATPASTPAKNIGENMPEKQRQPLKKPTSQDGLQSNPQMGSTPKKRIVSDGNWLNEDASPKAPPASTPPLLPLPKLRETKTYVRPGSDKPDAWIRRKSTPGKRNSSQREKKAAANGNAVKIDADMLQRSASKPSPNSVQDLKENLEMNIQTTPHKQTDEGVEEEIIRSAPAKLGKPAEAGPSRSNEAKITPIKGAWTRKRAPRRAPSLSELSTGETSSAEDDTNEPSPKPFSGRLNAWLSQTPDPFVESLDDPANDDMRPLSISDNGSMLGPRKTPIRPKSGRSQGESRIQSYNGSRTASDNDDYSTHSTPVLKRSGARRGDHRETELVPRMPLKATDRANTVKNRSNDYQNAAKKPSKRSLASHADLLSVLSRPQGVKGIVSARSVRTSRKQPGSATLADLMVELKSDEEKYICDLRTLVDGVIPVLLSSVLSQAKPLMWEDKLQVAGSKEISKEIIISLGIALERLHGMHKRLPTRSPQDFVSWAQQCLTPYENYIRSWRLGFRDVVIDLAFAHARHGDHGFQGDGERVNVAFLLKRPLVRLKYLAKTLKSINQVQPAEATATLAAKYQDLVEEARLKQDREHARLEDEAASDIDATRARNPETLAPLAGVQINRNRCVRARDVFDLKMHHSSGQRLDCHVMTFLRDEFSGYGSRGDVLIVELDSTSRWLLFPPTELTQISARLGNSNCEVVIMLRGSSSVGQEWRELLSLEATSPETALDWIEMLGSNPLPPALTTSEGFKDVTLNHRDFARSLVLAGSGQSSPEELDIPLGEQSVLSFGRDEISPERSNNQTTPRRYHKRNHSANVPPRTIGNEPKFGRRSRFDHDEHYGQVSSAPPSPHHGEMQDANNRAKLAALKIESWLSNAPDMPAGSQGTKQRDAATNEDDYAHMDVLRKAGSQRPVTSRRLSTVPSEGILSQGQNLDHKTPLAPGAASRSPPEHLRGSFTPHTAPPRRSSSPLKHEYEPSDDSESSSVMGYLASGDDGSITSESSIDDFIPDPRLPVKTVRGSFADRYTPTGLASASPRLDSYSTSSRGSQQQNEEVTKVVASIYSWSDRGLWNLLYPDDCSIVVTPGLIEAFEMSAAHSAPRKRIWTSSSKTRVDSRPLVALELTPLVPLRQSTAIDITIRSPPTSNSKVRAGSNIMFRSRTGGECEFLYNLINQARINNPTYLALQNARGPMGGSNWASYMEQQASRRGGSSWWRLGSRKSSYRAATTRRSASIAETISSVVSMSSAIAALKRFSSGSNMFNVGRSTVSSVGALSNEKSNSSFESSSGSSTPAVLDPMGSSPAGLTDMKVRMYERETASKWRDMGAARLTIMHPPRASTTAMISPTGHLKQEKRIVIIGKTRGETLLDVTLGETSFERVARTGVAVKVWEQIDQMGKTGGVSGTRMRVYMIQMKSEAEAAYTFSLVGRLRY